MDKHGKQSDNSENLQSSKVEKIFKPSINRTLSLNQFGHLQTATDKNT
jgi:hypothetical protein